MKRSGFTPKPCKQCGFMGHTAMYHKRKALNKFGPVAKKTKQAVDEWSKDQKPNHQGYYVCFYCDGWIEKLTAEHTMSKARSPEFRTDKTKFVVTCPSDNERKGSLSAKEYILKYYPEKKHLLDLLA